MTQVVDNSQLLGELCDGSRTIGKTKVSEKEVGESQSHELLSRVDVKTGCFHDCIIHFFRIFFYFLNKRHLNRLSFHETTVNLSQLLEVRVDLIFLL